MNRIYLKLIVCLIVALQTQSVFASESTLGSKKTSISSVTRLDLEQKKIVGERAEYTLILPALWSGYLIADREKQNDESEAIEKIIFHYVPSDQLAKPVFLMSLSVFDSASQNIPPIRKFLQTNRYIFGVELAMSNTFDNVTDNALFKRFLSDASDDALLESFIQVPPNQKKIVKDTVYVYGSSIRSRVIRDDMDCLFLPVRETCMAMDYKVNWLDSERSIEIYNDTTYELIRTLNKEESKDIAIIDGKAYATLLFFVDTLGQNIEVDENNNVYISR